MRDDLCGTISRADPLLFFPFPPWPFLSFVSAFNATIIFTPTTPVETTSNISCGVGDLVCRVMDLSFLACSSGFPSGWEQFRNESMAGPNNASNVQGQQGQWNQTELSDPKVRGACPMPITAFPPPVRQSTEKERREKQETRREKLRADRNPEHAGGC